MEEITSEKYGWVVRSKGLGMFPVYGPLPEWRVTLNQKVKCLFSYIKSKITPDKTYKR